jgi:hypothetical protein
MSPTIVGKEPTVDYKANPELDPAFVPDKPDFDAPPAEGDESKGFGEIMQDRLDKKPAVEKTDAPPKEPTKAPEKEPVKPATTPIRDVLDAVLSQDDPAVAKPTVEETKSPVEEFKDVTEGVRSEHVKDRMVKMRTKISDLWTENQRLAKERGEFQTKARPALEDPEVKALLDAKDKELQQAREALLAFDIESSPEFKSEFVGPRNKLARSAAMKLQSYGGNGQELLNALSMPEGIHRDQAIEGLTANIPDYAKNKITGFVNQIEQLDEKANEKRANAPQTWEEMNARAIDRQRKAAEKYKSDVTTLYEGITKELAKDPFFRQVGDDVQGSSEWNTGVTGTLQRGLNHILGSDNTIERSLVIAAKGERYDSVAKIALDERARRIAAEKKVAEYEGVQPGFRGSRKPEPKGEDDELKDLPFGEQMARRAAARSEDPD